MAQFTDAQVAAYIRDNNLTPDQVQQAAAQFGVAPEQLARATGLLNTGDASIQRASQSYQEAARQELLNSFSPAARETSYTLPSQRTGILDERGDDIQTYKEVAKEGPFTYYQTYDAYGNKTGDPFALRTGDNAADFLQAATMFGSVVGAPFLSSAIAGAAPSLSQAAVSGLTGAATAGGGTLLTGGSVEDALKNALVAGGLAYGGASLFGGEGATSTPQVTDRQMAIADARQLADAGLSQSQIGDILSASGYPEAIVTRALESVAPSSTVSTRTPTVTAPAGGVEIVGAAPINIPAIVGGATGGLLSSTSMPNVEVVSQKPTQGVAEGALGGLLTGGNITTPSVTTTQPTTPSDQVVEVTAERERPSSTVFPTVPTITQTPPASPIQPSPIEIPEIKSDASTSISPSDVLKILSALGMLGGAAGIGTGGPGAGGPFVAPTQGVPQYGSDYYNAVQQYYNAYMPEMPRDVATPLQKWYESKYGA